MRSVTTFSGGVAGTLSKSTPVKPSTRLVPDVDETVSGGGGERQETEEDQGGPWPAPPPPGSRSGALHKTPAAFGSHAWKAPYRRTLATRGERVQMETTVPSEVRKLSGKCLPLPRATVRAGIAG